MQSFLHRRQPLLLVLLAGLVFHGPDALAQRGRGEPATLDAQLEQAARSGSLEEVKRLLDAGANANATLRQGMSTPLLRASNKGNLDVMKLLIERGADVNHRAPDSRTPLIEASMHRSIEPLKLLLDSGAKPTAGAMSSVCFKNRSTIAKVNLLLAAGASPSAGMSGAGFARNLDVLKLLLRRGADINGQDEQKNSALHGAVSHGDIEIVKFLLSKKANPNLQGQSGNTALHIAARGGNTQLLKLLLANNADPVKRNDELVSPTRLSAMRGNEPFYRILVQASGGKERFEPIDSTIRGGKSIEELIKVATSKFSTPEEYQTCMSAMRGLVSYGAEAAEPVANAVREHPNNGQLSRVLLKLGPQAKDVLPMFEKMLSDKETVQIALAMLSRLIPGYLDRLPKSTKQQADIALLAAVMDSKSIEDPATYSAVMLSDEAALKLLESEKKHLQQVASSVAARRPGTELSKRVTDYQLQILGEATDLRDREQAVRWLGGRKVVDARAVEAFWKILRDTARPVPNLRGEQQTQQSRRQHFVTTTSRHLGRALTKDQLEKLLPLLSVADDEHLRLRALTALKNIKPELFPRVVEWLQHDNSAIALSASIALQGRSNLSLESLVAALERFDDEGKIYVLLTLEGLQAFEVKETLFEIAGNDTNAIALRAAAATALMGTTNKLAPNEKQALLSDLPKYARCIELEGSPVKSRFLQRLQMLGADGAAAIPVLKQFLKSNPVPKYEDDPKRFQEGYQIERVLIDLERALD